MIEIDQTGNKTISYVALDEITRLTSREETEQFLDQNLTLNISISQFCWVDLIIGFENPTWETIQDHRQGHSRMQSKSPTASSSKSAAGDQTLSLADVSDDIPQEQTSNTDTPRTGTTTQHRLPTIPDHID